MDTTTVILVTLVAYKLVLLGLGWIASRRTSDRDDFFLGGRRVGPWVTAISAAASSSSAWTLLGVSGRAYEVGLGALWLLPGCLGGFLLNWYGLAPGLRARTRVSRALTATDVVAAGTGRQRRLVQGLASLAILFALAMYVGKQFQAAGTTFAETFAMNGDTAIAIGAAIIVAYTLLGGFLAVSFTDTLQGLLMAATALLLPLVALVQLGGFGELFAGLGAAGETFLDPFAGQGVSVGLGMAIGYLGIGLGYPGQPHVVNRFMALGGDESSLRAARRISIGWALVIYPGMLLTGWCARALEILPSATESALFALAGGVFPPVLAGLMTAAILSAIMSTADSQLLVGASTLCHDLGLARGKSPQRTILLSRLAVFLLAAGGVAAAILWDSSIFAGTLYAWGLLGASLGPILLFRAWRRPVGGVATLLAMSVGLGFTGYAWLSGINDLVVVLVLPFMAAFVICGLASAGKPIEPLSLREH